MNKKAQFYIIAAVVLIAITFGLFAEKKTISKPDRTFRELVDNYVAEAPFAANSGMLEDFTLKFYDFALSKDSNFEMMYLYISDDNVSAFSLVKSTIFINQYNLTFNRSLVFQKTNEAVVSIGTEQYAINTTSDGLKTIFISQKENSRNVKIV